MEEMLGNIPGARQIFERLKSYMLPNHQGWFSYIQFELRTEELRWLLRFMKEWLMNFDKDGVDYDVAVELVVALSEFEEQCKDIERAHCVYKLYGDKEKIDDAILNKRRVQYEDETRRDPLNYDSWFSYIQMEEKASLENMERIRNLYQGGSRLESLGSLVRSTGILSLADFLFSSILTNGWCR
ncbi:unnamed protein product [Dovyalis caffra]|uniref:Uncharacterized protein n=1 Tax=Dovyalis caffra TaxID=77055 RepID=A0AAV1RK31_9ROSI|nr:unnamed protein product [Dovyalis caffra]